MRFGYAIDEMQKFHETPIDLHEQYCSHSGSDLLATGLYGTCGFVPAWIHEGKATPDGIAILAALRKVLLKGSKKSDYIVPLPSFATEDPGLTKALRVSAAFRH